MHQAQPHAHQPETLASHPHALASTSSENGPIYSSGGGANPFEDAGTNSVNPFRNADGAENDDDDADDNDGDDADGSATSDSRDSVKDGSYEDESAAKDEENPFAKKAPSQASFALSPLVNTPDDPFYFH